MRQKFVLNAVIFSHYVLAILLLCVGVGGSAYLGIYLCKTYPTEFTTTLGRFFDDWPFSVAIIGACVTMWLEILLGFHMERESENVAYKIECLIDRTMAKFAARRKSLPFLLA